MTLTFTIDNTTDKEADELADLVFMFIQSQDILITDYSVEV